MALVDQNPHIKNLALVADPQTGNPFGYRIVVDTDLNPDTNDPSQRREVADMVGLIEAYMRAGIPGLTRVTLHRV